ncbi:MAG: methyltransferase, partial [Usitatibacteraceae bacterium]
GVDLSASMLSRARERNIYDQLVESDLLSFLQKNDRQFELITATDVLIYVGDLELLFAQISAHLATGGIFAFSTESPPDLDEDFRLETSGRFAHRDDYIERLATLNGMRVVNRIDTVIRTEKATPLSGHIFILQND